MVIEVVVWSPHIPPLGRLTISLSLSRPAMQSHRGRLACSNSGGPSLTHVTGNLSKCILQPRILISSLSSVKAWYIYVARTRVCRQALFTFFRPTNFLVRLPGQWLATFLTCGATESDSTATRSLRFGHFPWFVTSFQKFLPDLRRYAFVPECTSKGRVLRSVFYVYYLFWKFKPHEESVIGKCLYSKSRFILL